MGGRRATRWRDAEGGARRGAALVQRQGGRVVCTNDKALSIAINLAANLARLDLHHALLLGADAKTCALLGGAAPPACVWTSLLTRHRRRLREYGALGMPLLWLQRWYYLHALLRLDLNALMLDADVVLFRDPYGTRLGRGASHTRTAPPLTRSCRYRYPYLKGAFANVTMIANFDRSTPAREGQRRRLVPARGGRRLRRRATRRFCGRTLALVNDSSVPILRHGGSGARSSRTARRRTASSTTSGC